MHNQSIVRDCPARTADRGYFSWESNADIETISDHCAATHIAAAIASGSEAYGHGADDLTDILTNLNAAELRDFVLAVLFPEAYPESLIRARNHLKQKCGELANEAEEPV